MLSHEAVIAALDVLERTGTPCMIVGSLSCNVYAIPRSTQDADFVIQLKPGGEKVLLEELGKVFRIEPQMGFETVTGTTRFVAESTETAFKIELFLLSDDPHDQQRFARRRRLNVLGREAFVASPEDVVVTKLRWSRQGRRAKDLDDIRNVIAAQRNNLDWDYIHAWCDKLGTRELLEQVRRSIPPL